MTDATTPSIAPTSRSTRPGIASQFAVRAVVTLGLAAAIYGVFALSSYEFRFDLIWSYRALYLQGLGLTIVTALLAYGIGLVLGVFVALARLHRSLWIRHLGDLYVEVIRGTPVLVLLGIAYWGVAPVLGVDDKLLVGTVTLGIFAAAYTGEILRAGIESIERGQFEAARSLGLSRRQTMRHVILPQAFKRMIPPLTSELIALTKETSLLWAIGVVELLAAARQAGANSHKTFDALLIAAALYLAITIPLSLLARHLERRMGRNTRSGVDL